MRVGARIGLWGLFALLLIAGGLLLLPACGLDLSDRLTRLESLRSRFCPVPVDRTAYLRASERRKAQEERIRKAQIAIARIPRCATPETSPPTRRAGDRG